MRVSTVLLAFDEAVARSIETLAFSRACQRLEFEKMPNVLIFFLSHVTCRQRGKCFHLLWLPPLI